MADAPVDALLLRAEDLTKGWLLALLEQAPLDDAPAILAADLARDGPRVCSAVARALADESDLRRLEPGGALEPLVSRTGEIAGARGVETTAQAVDVLRAVIWTAMRAELGQPEVDQVSELAERLTLVIELVRAAALRRCAETGASAGAERDEPPGRADERSGGPDERSGGPDERSGGPDEAPGAPDEAPGASEEAPSAPGPPARPEPTVLFRAPEPPSGSLGAPAGRRLDSLWQGALADEIVRSEHGGSALALLLVELEDADRLVAVESPGEATATFGRFAQAVRSVVRRQDILACETDNRAWIIARDTGRLGAHALATRMVASVASAPPWRGAPMTVTVGLAVLGEDGANVEALLEAAEEARYAAAASGVGVIPIDRPSGGGPEQPAGAGPELAG